MPPRNAPASTPPPAPGSTAAQLGALQREFQKAPPENGVKPEVREQGLETNIPFSLIFETMRAQNEVRAKRGEPLINFAEWGANAQTLEALQLVLPESDGKKALLKGLQLAIDTPDDMPPAGGSYLQQPELAQRALEKLKLIRERLNEHANVEAKLKTDKETLLKPEAKKGFSKFANELEKRWDRMETTECVASGLCVFLAARWLWKKIGAEGGGGFIGDTIGFVSLLGVGNALTKIGTGESAIDMLKDTFDKHTNGKDSQTEIADGNKKGLVDLPAMRKDLGPEGGFAEEICILHDAPVEIVLNEYSSAKAEGRQKLDRKKLGISTKKRDGLSDEQLFQLADKMFMDYPRLLLEGNPLVEPSVIGFAEEKVRDAGNFAADKTGLQKNFGVNFDKELLDGKKPRESYLSLQERRELRDLSPVEVMRKWYVEEPRKKNIKMSFGSLWQDFIYKRPPPGRHVKTA